MTITTEELRARNMAEVNAFIAHGCNPTYGGTPLPRAQEAVATVLHDLEATVERLRGALEATCAHFDQPVRWSLNQWWHLIKEGPSGRLTSVLCQSQQCQALSTTQDQASEGEGNDG